MASKAPRHATSKDWKCCLSNELCTEVINGHEALCHKGAISKRQYHLPAPIKH